MLYYSLAIDLTILKYRLNKYNKNFEEKLVTVRFQQI